MHCTRCQHDNREGARFCRECGATFSVSCPSCGAVVEPGSRFCDNCGSALTEATPPSSLPSGLTSPDAYTPKYLADKILTSRSALEGERKQVTVLFADLKASMELLADRDPEEARQLLDPVLELMMEAVHRYEGTVNHVMGDGIMALFGAPVAHEDHGVRACYAALDMQASMRRYTEEIRRSHGIELAIRVGLHSGEVVVRTVGSDLRMDYSAVGQTTHLAARMEQLATPGSIRLTAATLGLAEGYVAVNALGPVPVKGLDAPVEVYEIVGPGPGRSRLQAAAARGLTEFVGRRRELDLVHQALGRAAAGEGQVIAVVGEPGVGKSRLAWEVTHSHRTHGWLTLEGRSVSYGKTTPYLPVIDLLKAYFGIDDRDQTRSVQEKVTGKLLALDRAFEPLLPAFLTLLDVAVEDPDWQALEPDERRERTLDAIKRLLLRESQVQPLLVVCEDLHWIDSETQTLLDRLVDSLPAARLLLFVNYRPEYQHSWANRSYYSQLRLEPLPPESAEELLQVLLGEDTSVEPLAQSLIELTQGNPFFLEECVRSLAETEVLVGGRGSYRVRHSADAPRVPPTVQAVLAARIDRLPPNGKSLVQMASVIGKDVPGDLLQTIADLPDETFRQALTHLQAAEFLRQTSSANDLELTFKHALTHDVAYGSLLKHRRRAIHVRILEALEARTGDGLAQHHDRLAHHAVRGEVWDRAVDYLRQAVAAAIARSAHREAAGYVQQAMAALYHLPDSRERLEQAVDLRFELKAALWPFGTMALIGEAMLEAETLAESLKDPRRTVLAAVHRCSFHYSVGEHDLAVAAGERALARSRTVGAFDLQVLAGSNLGQALVARTDYLEGTQVLEETLKLLEGPLSLERFDQAVYPAVLARLNQVRGLVELGRFDEAIARGEEAVEVAQKLEHPSSLILAHYAAGLPRLRRGELAYAIRSMEQSQRISLEKGLPIFQHWFAGSLAEAYALVGRVGEALTLLEQLIDQDAAMNVLSQNTLNLFFLAEANLLDGNFAEATRHAEHALELARERNERGYRAWLHWLVGEIIASRAPREVSEAVAAYEEALRLAEDMGMRPLQAHCHFGSGRALRASGRLNRAAELYREMDMRFWLDRLGTEEG